MPAPISPLLWALGGVPRLLVPASLLKRFSEAQWDTLLAHELAHLRRGDHCVRLLELAALALYWWHPVVWWARRQLREAEEQCCDAWVVWALPGAAEVYAGALVEAVTYLSGARSVLPLAASGIGHMHILKRRLTMIVKEKTPRRLSAAGSLAMLGLAALLLPLHPTWALTEAQQDQAPGRSTPGATTSGIGSPSAFVTAYAANGFAEDQPNPGVPANAAPARAGAGEGRWFFGAPGGTSEGRPFSEAVQDAQDEVELLRVQPL